MANPYKKAEDKKKVAPGGNGVDQTVREEPVVEEPKTPTNVGNPLEGLIDPPKPEGKSYGFYLSAEAVQNLERLAKQNRCSKSKALDALLRSLS